MNCNYERYRPRQAASVRHRTLSEKVRIKVSLLDYLLCQTPDLRHQSLPAEVSRVKTDADDEERETGSTVSKGPEPAPAPRHLPHTQRCAAPDNTIVSARPMPLKSING